MDLSRDPSEYIKRYWRVVSKGQAFKYFPLIVERAENARIWSIDGKEYIDFLSSAATYNVGHSNKHVVEAVKEQVNRFIHYCLYLYHIPVIELAEKLVQITPGDFSKKVAFGLSGGDACDIALKASLIYTRRPMIVSYTYSYHGTTALDVAVGGSFSEMIRSRIPFKNVVFLEYPDVYRCKYRVEDPELCGEYYLSEHEDTLRRLEASQNVASLIIEPIQGDGGVLVPPVNYMRGIRKIISELGAVFIDDEVQTGMGRTGRLFATEHFDVTPDLLVAGKALGAGMPISAVIGREEILDSAPPQTYFSTSAAHAMSCVAALRNINYILEHKLVERARDLGKYVLKRLNEMKEKYEIVGDVRGLGLMIGVDIVKDKKTKTPDRISALKIIWRSWEKGLVMMTYGKYGNVLRIAPPLTIPEEDLDKGLDIIEESIKDVLQGKIPDEVVGHMVAWESG